MQIIIEDVAENRIPLVVDPTDTIASVKSKIQVCVGVRPELQKLNFANWFLHDSQTLAGANIQHQSTLHLQTNDADGEIFFKNVKEDIEVAGRATPKGEEQLFEQSRKRGDRSPTSSLDIPAPKMASTMADDRRSPHLHLFAVGTAVEYFSATHSKFIRTVVTGHSQDGCYVLQCKPSGPGVPAEFIRRPTDTPIPTMVTSDSNPSGAPPLGAQQASEPVTLADLQRNLLSHQAGMEGRLVSEVSAVRLALDAQGERVKAAEETIVAHTSRLDSHDLAIDQLRADMQGLKIQPSTAKNADPCLAVLSKLPHMRKAELEEHARQILGDIPGLKEKGLFCPGPDGTVVLMKFMTPQAATNFVESQARKSFE